MKRWLIILLGALLVLVGVAVFSRLADRPAPPVAGPIILPDGSWAYIEAITYGTNHLVGPPLSHVAQRLPQSMRSLMVRLLGRRAAMRFTHATSSPKLVVWLNRGLATPFPTNLGALECVLSDTNDFPSGNVVPFAARYPLTVVEFDVFPRRAPEINLSIYHHDAAGVVSRLGTVAFVNPVYRTYPGWKPEPLPITKRVEDLEVTLERVHTGLKWNSDQEAASAGSALVFKPDLMTGGSATVCEVRWRSAANTNELWRVASVVISDPTGNRVTNASPFTDDANGYVKIPRALWSSEPGWKMEFEFIQTSGLGTNALVTFRDVPFGARNSTNPLALTATCQGLPITLIQIAWQALPTNPNPSSPGAGFELLVGTLNSTNELRGDLISARTDTGAELVFRSQTGIETNRIYQFSPPSAGVKTMSVTFAVQRSRRVEFLVQPERKTMRFERRP